MWRRLVEIDTLLIPKSYIFSEKSVMDLYNFPSVSTCTDNWDKVHLIANLSLFLNGLPDPMPSLSSPHANVILTFGLCRKVEFIKD